MYNFSKEEIKSAIEQTKSMDGMFNKSLSQVDKIVKHSII